MPSDEDLLRTHARDIFTGLDSEGNVEVLRKFDGPAGKRFYDWAYTARWVDTFMGFDPPGPPRYPPDSTSRFDPPPPPRLLTIRVFTTITVDEEGDPIEGDPIDGFQSQWDQLTALAQLGVRAVGRPVVGTLSVVAPPG